MVLLSRLSSWFLISKRNIQVHKKDTLELAIHSSCLKAVDDRGRLRLNQVLNGEFKVKSPPDFPPPPCLASAWGECSLTQSEERSILGRPGQRAGGTKGFLVVVEVRSYRISKGGEKTKK